MRHRCLHALLLSCFLGRVTPFVPQYQGAGSGSACKRATASHHRSKAPGTTTGVAQQRHTASSSVTLGMSFASEQEYLDFLQAQGELPAGFSIGSTGLEFTPVEVAKPATMNVTVIALDKPSEKWAAVFTLNKFPGAPVILGREQLASGAPIQAVVVNNKISNVCAPDGIADAKRVCSEVQGIYGLEGEVLPSSTGVIGWRLPADSIIAALPDAKAKSQRESLFPAAKAIMTTDRYPKLRGTPIGRSGARLVGMGKGAGMIEPNMATMLAFLLTDLDLPRESLQSMLKEVVDKSFNSISVDSDTSTSDTVVLISSGEVSATEQDVEAFRTSLTDVCQGLAEDIVRNGEGVGHVLKVCVKGSPSARVARRIGKEVVNSPLFTSAIAGNDPNVGRLLGVVGRVLAIECPAADTEATSLAFGDRVVFEKGQFLIDEEMENELFTLFKSTDMVVDGAHLLYPPHFKCIDINIDLGLGSVEETCWGGDLTAEYVRINADYRS